MSILEQAGDLYQTCHEIANDINFCDNNDYVYGLQHELLIATNKLSVLEKEMDLVGNRE